MSLWNDKWVVHIGIVNGFVDGNKYYFATKEEAEAFRLKIATEKDVKWCYVHGNEESQDAYDSRKAEG
jgi:hypothetical protein